MTSSDNTIRRATLRLVAATVLAAGLAACANVQPYEFTAIDEIPPRPGLFSGEAGEFVFYHR